LFRPAKRALAWPRAKRLLQELVELIQAGKISRNGREWPAPPSAWRHGIEYVLQRRDQGRLKTPLDSHGYLLEVLAGEADKAEAKDERDRERHRADRRDGDAWDAPARAQSATTVSASSGVNWVQHAFNAYLDHCATRWHTEPTFEGLTKELQEGRKQMGLPPLLDSELQAWFQRAEQKIGKPLVHASAASAASESLSDIARSFGKGAQQHTDEDSADHD
jgi:hypothetical protein